MLIEELQGRDGTVPVRASSGRIRRSMFVVSAASRRALALAMFSEILPSWGENCRHAIRILGSERPRQLYLTTFDCRVENKQVGMENHV